MAYEDYYRNVPKLVITKAMDRETRDALVATWVLRLWHDVAESSEARRDGKSYGPIFLYGPFDAKVRYSVYENGAGRDSETDNTRHENTREDRSSWCTCRFRRWRWLTYMR